MTGKGFAVAWSSILPADWRRGRFVGRIDLGEGPVPILIETGLVRDVSGAFPTVSMLLAQGAPAIGIGAEIGPLATLSPDDLLSPVDLQCVKAAGVTFAVSTLERVIEERAKGDAEVATRIRAGIEESLGGSLGSIRPGSPEAEAVKVRLIAEGLWSQYLEVAIGPDAEIFTKAPVLSTVGPGAAVGIRSDSRWNNPEPEIVIVADATGAAVGATLGNDVNLRDFEGRSALLLGKAKDNNASASLGPLIRLFDGDFTMDDVRAAEVEMVIRGPDGFKLRASSSMSLISRDPVDLLGQVCSEHQYPDGLVLYLGTMFAPTADRDEPGRGFTHREGDEVCIFTERLGSLRNRVTTARDAPQWICGIGELTRNLASRGLLR